MMRFSVRCGVICSLLLFYWLVDWLYRPFLFNPVLLSPTLYQKIGFSYRGVLRDEKP